MREIPAAFHVKHDYNLIPEWIYISFYSLLLIHKHTFNRRIEFSRKHVGFNDEWFEVRTVAAGSKSPPGKKKDFSCSSGI